jgi:hypothetical protein
MAAVPNKTNNRYVAERNRCFVVTAITENITITAAMM